MSCQDGKLPLLLVAEDTDSNFLLVSLMFRKEFDIVRAVNGEEAVRICREMNPAAILMDIKMPVMDGFEATRRIRAFDPVVPIVAVTAFAYDRDRQKALAAGANEYVAKPLSGEHIRRVLGTLLAGGEPRRALRASPIGTCPPFSGGSPAAKLRRRCGSPAGKPVPGRVTAVAASVPALFPEPLPISPMYCLPEER